MSKQFAASAGSYFLVFALLSSSFVLYNNIDSRTGFLPVGEAGTSFWELFGEFFLESLGAGALIAFVSTLVFIIVFVLYWRRTSILLSHACLSAVLTAVADSYVITFGLIVAGESVKGPPGIIVEVMNSFSGLGLLIFLIVATILFSYIGFSITWLLIRRNSSNPA